MKLLPINESIRLVFTLICCQLMGMGATAYFLCNVFLSAKKMNQWMDSNNEEIPNNKYPVLLLSFLISFTSIGLYKEPATHLLNLLNINAASSQIIPLSFGPFIFFFLCYFLLSLFVKIFDKKERVLYIYWIWALFALWKILAILYSLL